MGMSAIRYARGTSKFDAYPELREVPDFHAFEHAVLTDRARTKGQQFICAPLKVNGDGTAHRGKDDVARRRFLALDIDHIAGAEVYANLRLWFIRFGGFGFTTASSTPDAPRCRVIIELDREIDRIEGMRLGAAIARDVGDEFGENVKLDPSTHRGEQPCYLPVFQSEPFHLDGDPLDVDRWLDGAPELEPERKGSAAIAPGDDPVIMTLKERGMYRRDLGAGRHAMRCPKESAHTTEDDAQSTATVYFQPHHAGFVTAGFKCQHAHCAGLTGDDLLAFLGIDWRDVTNAYKPAQSAPGNDHGADDAVQHPGEVNATAANDDPPPLDILRHLVAPPLRVDDVPDVLACFAQAHARATGFDVSILLTGGIVAAAAMLSDDVRLCVLSQSSWFESARLWAVTIGGPGSGKTPGLKTAMAPVFALHRELLGEWVREHGADEKPPPKPALYTSDATTEALADLLHDNERGLLYFVDELESWLASHDAYRSGAGRDRGEWLRLYDGGPHQVNRVRRGSFFVPNWGASLLSATTPAALRKLAPKLPDDGLLQRLLLVLARARELPDGTMLRLDTKGPTEAWDAALRRLYAIPKTVVHLSGEARAAFELEQRELHGVTLAFEDLHPPFAAHLAKRPGMLARLALTFHALEAPDIKADISGATMARAVRFMRRQERHAQAVYSTMLGADTGVSLAKAIARSILASRLELFNRRELTPRCKAFRLADEQTRIAALSLLSDCGWVSCSAHVAAYGAFWRVDNRVHELFSEHGDAAREQRAAVRARILGGE